MQRRRRLPIAYKSRVGLDKKAFAGTRSEVLSISHSHMGRLCFRPRLSLKILGGKDMVYLPFCHLGKIHVFLPAEITARSCGSTLIRLLGLGL